MILSNEHMPYICEEARQTNMDADAIDYSLFPLRSQDRADSYVLFIFYPVSNGGEDGSIDQVVIAGVKRFVVIKECNV